MDPRLSGRHFYKFPRLKGKSSGLWVSLGFPIENPRRGSKVENGTGT